MTRLMLCLSAATVLVVGVTIDSDIIIYVACALVVLWVIAEGLHRLCRDRATMRHARYIAENYEDGER
jgi:hypothetical protein